MTEEMSGSRLEPGEADGGRAASATAAPSGSSGVFGEISLTGNHNL